MAPELVRNPKTGNIHPRILGCEDTCHRVAVIDPEDADQVALLALAYAGQEPTDIPARMQAALREFAAPTPPKPAEPQGLGAVVEDAKGERWARAALGWWHSGETARSLRSWDAIPAVRVLSEGVE